jgi:hypothetical protein
LPAGSRSWSIAYKSVDVLSKRVGNYQHSPFWMLIDQLWVR